MDTGPERAETVGRRRTCTRPRWSLTLHNSGGQAVREGCIESFRGRVVGEAQDVAAADASQPARARDEQEAERAHAPDQVRRGAFAGAGFRGGQGVELEAPDEVVSEDAEL